MIRLKSCRQIVDEKKMNPLIDRDHADICDYLYADASEFLHFGKEYANADIFVV